MPLTPGQQLVCAMIFGTSLGVGGTVAVQKARPPVVKHQSKKVSQRAPLHKAKPPAFRSLPSKGPALLDCPVIGSPFAAEPNLIVPLDPLPPGFGGNIVGAPLSPPVWGGGSPLPPPPMIPGPSAPAVPDAPTWAMLVAGFVAVGASMRTRRLKKEAISHDATS